MLSSSRYTLKRPIQQALISVWVLGLTACNSTPSLDPGNPLPGIALEASKQQVLFSWSNKSPLIQQLRPNTNIQLLASYDTQHGPVTNEVVAVATVRSGINGVKLTLNDTTKFMPTSQVCLRIANGFRPIPVRIARPGESSSGFFYPRWSDLVSKANVIRSAEIDVRNATTNVQNLSQPDNNFEQFKQQNNLRTVQDCDLITTTAIPTRPKTALAERQRSDAAAQQCVALYNQMAKTRRIPPADSVVNVLKSAQVNGERVGEMETDFKQFSPGKIWFTGSRLPLDNQLVTAWRAEHKEGLSANTATIVLDTYTACKAEANQRFEESYQDWQLMSRPEIIQQQVKPMQQMCKVRFSRHEQRMQALAAHKTQLKRVRQTLAQLKAQQQTTLPARSALIPNACPAENG